MTAMQHNTEEAVFIFLDGQGLDDAIYQSCDLYTLEDLLIKELEPDGTGELDGHERGPEQTTIHLYGPDAAKIFSRLRPILTSYPLCRTAEPLFGVEAQVPASEK